MRASARVGDASASGRHLGRKLEIFWAGAGPTGDSGEHAGAEFLVIVKCEDEVWPAFPSKRTVGAGLSLDLPADSQQGRKDAPSLG